VGESIVKKPVYFFGQFRFDGYVLESKGVPVPLAPKVADTLLVLLEHPGELVTKDALIETVWGGAFVAESGLARNISVLRKTLEDHGGPGPYIETVAKRGYRFVAPIGSPVEPADAPPPARSRRRPWIWIAAAALAVAAPWALSRIETGHAAAEANESLRIGSHLLAKRTPEDTARALSWFERAARENPRSAEAHVGVARALLMLPRLGRPSADAFGRAKTEAARALEIDPRLASAHAALGAARMLGEWKFAEAETSFKRALELDPNLAMAPIYYSHLLNSMRRFDDSLPLLDRARKIDPVSPSIGAQIGVTHYFRRDFERAVRELLAVLERERSDSYSHYYLALTYGFLGRLDDARRHLARADLSPALFRTEEAWLYLRNGERGPAEARFAEIREETRRGRAPGSALLLPAAALGRFEEAFAALDAAIAERSPDLLNLQADPRLSGLRGDPRYAAAIRRIGFP